MTKQRNKKHIIDFPDLMQEWDWKENNKLSLNPAILTSGSNKKAWWKCEKGHEWQAVINSRNSGVGCPYCSNKKILIGENDLATTNPQLASEWHPTKNGTLTPQQVTRNSNKRVWWLCSKNKQHEWQTSINSRSGCPFCSNKKIIIGENDLATINPQLASEWHPTKNGTLTPKDVTIGSDKKVWWKCEKGHEWQAHIYDRKNGKGCLECSKERKTSFPEQSIYYYFNKVTKAINRYIIAPRTEIDIYLPEFKIGIEYDGLYYHKDQKAKIRENKKQEKLNELGISLIRVKKQEKQFLIHTL